MKKTKWFRAYFVDRDQPWWHNRFIVWWGRKPKPEQTAKGLRESGHPHQLRLEWSFGLRSNFALGVQVHSEDQNEVVLRIGIPWLVSLYVMHSVSSRFTKRVLPWYQSNVDIGWSLDRVLSISTFEKVVFISLWTHPMDSGYGDHGRTSMPAWRNLSFSINPADLLGRRRCKTEIIEPEHPVLILMPEGDYAATLKVERRTWRRKLWPWWPLKLVRTTRDITCPNGIPFSGKGENSWDCGEDGIYGTGFDARTDEDACALFASHALQNRTNRGDPRLWPESPRDRDDRIETIRSQREHVASLLKEEKPS